MRGGACGLLLFSGNKKSFSGSGNIFSIDYNGKIRVFVTSNIKQSSVLLQTVDLFDPCARRAVRLIQTTGSFTISHSVTQPNNPFKVKL